MKTQIAGIALLFSNIALASQGTALVAGSYSGHGDWRDNSGQVGSYEITTTVNSDSISSDYQFDGQTTNWTLELVANGNGFFDVAPGSSTPGKMYCYEVQCHFNASGINLEETLTFYDSKLYKLGSKTIADGTTIMWQEVLQLQ